MGLREINDFIVLHVRLSVNDDQVPLTSAVFWHCFSEPLWLMDAYISHAMYAIYQQEAQLPQRNSASAAHVYLAWLTDRAMHKTPQNRGCRPTTRIQSYRQYQLSKLPTYVADEVF